MRILIGCLSLFFANIVFAVEIEEFKAGLVCLNGSRLASICHITENVYITGQSRCTWNGKRYPCTWYGYEFKYKNMPVPTTVTCVSKDTKLARLGNPREILSDSSAESTYTFELTEASGRFFNPQYSLFMTQSEEKQLNTTQTSCSINGELVFQFRLNKYFPIKQH